MGIPVPAVGVQAGRAVSEVSAPSGTQTADIASHGPAIHPPARYIFSREKKFCVHTQTHLTAAFSEEPETRETNVR